MCVFVVGSAYSSVWNVIRNHRHWGWSGFVNHRTNKGRGLTKVKIHTGSQFGQWVTKVTVDGRVWVESTGTRHVIESVYVFCLRLLDLEFFYWRKMKEVGLKIGKIRNIRIWKWKKEYCDQSILECFIFNIWNLV